MKKTDSETFLFSVDLEDVRPIIPTGRCYSDRFFSNTEKCLNFLSQHKIHCTFFTVGDIARRYPDLIRRIVDEGHEIACHGDRHITLDRLNRNSFQRDLEQSLKDLSRLGVDKVRGFRAPAFSLTGRNMWAYEVLSDLGFTYSSSVLPAKNPLYGWPGFGSECRQVIPGIWEIPLSISGYRHLNIPFSGGVYLRTLPFWVVRYFFHKQLRRRKPVVGYLHPHDIDVAQERFMYNIMRNNRFYNWLMYYNRKYVFKRLRVLFQKMPVVKYSEYVSHCLKTGKD